MSRITDEQILELLPGHRMMTIAEISALIVKQYGATDTSRFAIRSALTRLMRATDVVEQYDAIAVCSRFGRLSATAVARPTQAQIQETLRATARRQLATSEVGRQLTRGVVRYGDASFQPKLEELIEQIINNQTSIVHMWLEIAVEGK